LIHSDSTLTDLHNTLQILTEIASGWSDFPLYRFQSLEEIGDQSFKAEMKKSMRH